MRRATKLPAVLKQPYSGVQPSALIESSMTPLSTMRAPADAQQLDVLSVTSVAVGDNLVGLG